MRVNDAVWHDGSIVAEYANRVLRPPEVLVLVRHADRFAGRVLEVGCGAGRLTGYLVQLGRDVTGIDVSPAMVEYCRTTYPRGTFEVRDLRDLSGFEDGGFDVVFASFNVIDVLDDTERRATLREFRRVLAPDGLLIFSSHNRTVAPKVRTPVEYLRGGGVRRVARGLPRLPRSLRNRRRLAPLQRSEDGYELVNDEAHEYSLLMYYVTRDDQERQLADEGLSLLECLDGDGEPVAPGEAAAGYSELHYVARPA